MKKLVVLVLSSLVTLSICAQSAVPTQSEDIMLQGFYWDSYPGRSPYGSTRWATLYQQVQEIGSYFDLVWLPPSSYAEVGVGYHPIQYSNQNSTWGTRSELEQLISALHDEGTKVIADVVLDHIVGDSTWCDFLPEDFDQYGLFQPDGSFICQDDEMNDASTRGADLAGECWGAASGAIDDGENYLAARDWAHQSAQVQNMFEAYSRWLINVMHYDGFRYDYGLGYHTYHINDYNQASNPYISIAEFWTGLDETKNRIQDAQMNTMSLDFMTKYSVIDAIAGWNYIGRGTGLMADDYWKRHAVTFVENHDMFNNNPMEFGGQGNSLTPAMKYRLLQANALILSMPGVPNIFYPHWATYKTEIRKMIDARRSAGIHSESEVRDEEWNNDGSRNTGYQATIVGNNGWLILRLGTKTNGQALGDGWRLMASGYNISEYGPDESYEMWVYCSDTTSYIYNDTTYAPVIEEQFTISAEYNSLQGTVTGVGTYYYYDSCFVEAVPNEGFHFVQWSDGNNENPRMIYVTKDSTFTAEFEEDKCLLASGTCGDNLTWELSCDGELSINGSGEMHYDHLSSDDVPWKSYRNNITSVVISDGITSIETYAFYYCQNLISFSIPASVTTIGSHAFYWCTNLRSIQIPDGVINIEISAFNMCGIRSLQIPASVTSINNEAFNSCHYLTSVIIGDSQIKEGDEGLKLLGNCFSNCSVLSSVTLGNNVVYIGGNTFTNCTNLTQITIPRSTSTIIGSAFYGCYNLVSIDVDVSNPYYCSVDGVVYSKDMTEVVNCPQTKSGEYVLPETVTSVGMYAFQACEELTEVVLPEGVTTIGACAFSGCYRLSSMILPNTLTNIGGSAFTRCWFDTIVIPNSVKQIGAGAFYRCDSLRHLVIGDSVQLIGRRAFESCVALNSIYCYAITPPTMEWDTKYNAEVFYDVDKSIPLYVPAESIDLYRSADQWSDFTNIFPIPGTEIPCGADTRMPAPEYTFESIIGDCQSKLQFTNTSHVVTRDNGTTVHTTEPCNEVYWRIRRISDNVSIETTEMNPIYTCLPGGEMIEVSLTCFLDGGLCDSTIIDTIVSPYILSDNTEFRYHLCEGDAVRFDGKWFNKDTVYTANYTSAAGCDSTSTLILTTAPSYKFIEDTTLYVGDLVRWQNRSIKAEQTGSYHYYDTLKTYMGCDSIFVLNVEVLPITQKICSWLVESNDLVMGTVYTAYGAPSYPYGTQITVEASPNSGYKFVKWNDGKKYNPYRFTLLNDKYLLAIFMEEEEEQDTTTVQPTSTTATFTWPFIEGGFSYSLTIYSDAACTTPLLTLTFNQYGQLTGIHFENMAPRRTTAQEEGFTYTISGLDANTQYFFKMETRDEDNKLINTDEGSFSTTNNTTSVETISDHQSPITNKVFKDGVLYILRGNHTYTLTGQEVK